MDSILQISIRDYKLINLDEVYKLTDIQYSLYAILSVNRMYFEKPTVTFTISFFSISVIEWISWSSIKKQFYTK